ncbi:expressed unknown protein [Seminavis robusta]|uniref:Uncharacterized protein n=1 Tax=Seminavis robusta TaxID=568900 RepID=A0A9N8HXA0_9STRA|nr:expressed unknown protein [Seminavis robusta]|eukprot:Sro1772_g296710.1 n/a (265) ;mRNA; f:16667-17461
MAPTPAVLATTSKKIHHRSYHYYYSKTSSETRWSILLCLFMTLTVGMLRYRLMPIIIDVSSSEDKTLSVEAAQGDPTDPLSCHGLLARLRSSPKVELVAIDFDKTLLNIHTWGRWNQRSSDLVPHVRPAFLCFINSVLQARMPVAITTFSNQKELIQKVLARSLKAYDREHAQTEKEAAIYYIPVFGGDDWVKGHSKGKQSQLKLAMQYYNNQQQQKDKDKDNNKDPITPASTLLIDDDANNIKVARKDGYQAVLYMPTKVHGS